MNVLVTGGAGYIGSVVVEELIRDGHVVTAYDNLSKGHRESVSSAAAFVHAELVDTDLLTKILVERRIEAVIHMAADSLVAESVEHPSKYYRNNVVAGLAMLDAMRQARVKKLVFSSTAAVYGEPMKQPIEEDDPTNPTNTYGETKLAFERALQWCGAAYDFQFAVFRYFNAAGATAQCGEWHNPETHLIPLILEVAAGKRSHIEIYGDDYPTEDGTCVRDYVHVVDLARAHILSLRILDERSAAYNLGCGGGYSVKQVIKVAEHVTGKDIPVRIGPRRPGDPAVLVASSERIKRELGWSPQFEDLGSIIESAWSLMKRRRFSAADS
ncbi:MAG TPA: UDP-glucose 4-epimerase GalE [Pyrinomonadaceae bacterium]|nr:UDP-glucose 4-epimerase GalE [Pyrinomonadaceae bacterium]